MFIIEKFEISGFWKRSNASCIFNEDVNIIIGRNGTGKTTFMNILHSILTVDLVGLSESEFESAKISLTNKNEHKTIEVTKSDILEFPIPMVTYNISEKKEKTLQLVGVENRKFPANLKRRLYEESTELRKELYDLTSVTSLSVYRLRSGDEHEIIDRYGSRIVSPVDYRLSQVLAGLAEFQLELAEKAQVVSKSLQSEVLGSILYGEDDAAEKSWELDFNKEEERHSLISAYTQLNAVDKKIKKKIGFHVSAIAKSISDMGSLDETNKEHNIDIKPFEALRKTRRIIELSLDAKSKTQKIYSHIDKFLEVLESFICDKKFRFSSGRLVIVNKYGEIDHTKLSSGEKQLIILMVEALLQKSNRHIFLADEPELSLHVAWQKNIIPAVKQINPNAQVIVATHSPEVASKYKDAIFDMEKIIHV